MKDLQVLFMRNLLKLSRLQVTSISTMGGGLTSSKPRRL